jgi:glutamine cyclotransferase
VWFTECIARIDPNSGSINGWILLQGLKSEQEQTREPKMGRVDVLNGIAYEDKSNRIFVTGKLWHTLYEIEIREPDEMLGKGMETRSMCIPKQG